MEMITGKLRLAAMASAIVIASGCASDPKKISAAYVSPAQYRGWDCDQIIDESAHIERRSIELYQSLKKDADADKWQMGVGLILFWPALFALEGGDGPEASEYARLKGEYEALRTVSVEKRCDYRHRNDLKEVIEEKEAAEKS
jgi:hypothetical protein